MKFINTVGNTVRLGDIGRNIPYIGDEAQELEPEMVKKSSLFQSLILEKKFIIVEVTEDRIEQNLYRAVKQPESSDHINNAQVVIRGNFHSHSGYAKANRNLATGLNQLGIRTAIHPVNRSADGLNEMEIRFLELLCKPYTRDTILIHSTIPSFAEGSDNRYKIINTTVEAETIPAQFTDACNAYDEVWVVSDFCKEVLTKGGVDRPIYVIPNSVDHRLYNLRAKPHRFMPDLKLFRFVSVFGWNWRKGYDVLLKAYLRAFSGNDDVSLLIVSRYDYQGESREYRIEDEIKEFIAKYGGTNPPHVARCGRMIPEFEMPRLYRACQCFVLPSRGEGFGLPYMEASLCGLPVIATRHGGQLMFLNDDNSYLLDVDKVSTNGSEKSGVHFWEGQAFPELTSDKTVVQLGQLMRDVRDDYAVAQQKNLKLQADIITGYSCETVAKIAEARLEEIWKNL